MQEFCTSVNPKVCISDRPAKMQNLGMPGRHKSKTAAQQDDTFKKVVGRNLRITIAAVGLRPADAAREMGILPNKLGNWLRGDNYPDPFLVTRFCADHRAPLEMVYQGTAGGASKELAAGYAAARRRLDAGELDD
jgi:hypothetical protein